MFSPERDEGAVNFVRLVRFAREIAELLDNSNTVLQSDQENHARELNIIHEIFEITIPVKK